MRQVRAILRQSVSYVVHLLPHIWINSVCVSVGVGVCVYHLDKGLFVHILNVSPLGF